MAERRRGRREKRPAEASARRVFGLHASRAILEQRPEAIRQAWLLDSAAGSAKALGSDLERSGVAVRRVARAELDARTDGAVHQGIVLDIHPLKALSLDEFEDLVLARGNDLRLLLLDQVEDPRNLGACLRSAAAAGIDAVVVPKDRSAGLSPAAIKAAAGASEFVPVVTVTNLARTMRFLSDAGVHIVGAALDAPVSLYQAKLEPPVAIALGSEGAGLRRLTRDHCDELFEIPMRGSIESLNVAVSAGIVLFESLRRDL